MRPALSYSTIVLYSRDHKGVGVVHGKTSPASFSLTVTRQYWLGKIKPKQAFRLTETFSTSCYRFLLLLLNGILLADDASTD